MLELCLSALSPCSHIMLSQRSRLRDVDPFGRAAEKFLSLTPYCCTTAFTSLDSQTNSLPSTTSCSNEKYGYIAADAMKSLPTSINYGTKLSDSLYGNYHAYLCDARQKIKACHIACSNWSSRYDGDLSESNNTSNVTALSNENVTSNQSQRKTEESRILPLEKTVKNVMSENDEGGLIDNVLFNFQCLLEGKDLNSNEHNIKNESTTDTVLSLDEQIQLDADIAELLNEDIGVNYVKEACLDKKESDSCIDDSAATMNSLMSLGESSGYESFAFKGSPESTPDNETNENQMNEEPEEMHIIIKKETNDIAGPNVTKSDSSTTEKTSLSKPNRNNISCRQDIFNGQPNVGIFLDVVLRKLECMTSNNLYVNLHLTGLISRLAIYSQPLLQSFLLNHSLVFQPSIRSLFQVFVDREFQTIVPQIIVFFLKEKLKITNLDYLDIYSVCCR